MTQATKQNFVRLAFAGVALAAASLPLLTLGGCSSPCETTVVSNGGRRVIGEGTSEWRGSEKYQQVCTYQSDTPSGNFNLPGHLGMGGNGGAQSPTGSSARVITPN